MKKLNPLQINKLLPKKNCKKCGKITCLAFAIALLDRKASLDECKVLDQNNKEKIKQLIRPKIREIKIGNSLKIGGEEVLYRHKWTFFNQTAIAIDISDNMSKEKIIEKTKFVKNFFFERVGSKLRLDAISLRCASGDKLKFIEALKVIKETADIPTILCSLDTKIIDYALKFYSEKRPLIYAATEYNYKQMADLAKKYNCPIVVSNNKKIIDHFKQIGFEDIVLDTKTYPNEGIKTSIYNWTKARKEAIYNGINPYPQITLPITSWIDSKDEEKTKIQETILSILSIIRYSDIMILHASDIWKILPIITLRQNIYTDPRIPSKVDPGLKKFGNPDKNSPVFLTTNFTLTYFTVENDIEDSETDCYLLVVDTEGIGVESAAAGGQLSAEKISKIIKDTKIEDIISHRKIIIPQMAARLKWDIENITNWKVIIGPRDSSAISKFIKKMD